jgi:hypothetical protein
MIDLNSIKQAAQVVTDQKGEAVVQLPLPIWEKVIAQLEADTPNLEDLPQHERIKALLQTWKDQPDDTPAEWWDEFDKFMRENRLNFPERDLNLDDE